MKFSRIVPALCAFVLTGVAFAQTNAAPPVAAKPDSAALAKQILEKLDKVQGFSADLVIVEDDGTTETRVNSALVVARNFGWRLKGVGDDTQRVIVTDFNVSYDYHPRQKSCFMVKADTPEVKQLLMKPLTDINPLRLLDPKSLVITDGGQFEGEPVFLVEGTTNTQMMTAGTAPVMRKMRALIAKSDGLPRQTLEFTPETTSTTILRNVKIDPPAKAEDFMFVPPPGVKVIDVNEASKMRVRPRLAPKPGAAAPEGKAAEKPAQKAGKKAVQDKPTP